MGLAELKADAKLLREGYAKTPADKIDFKRELEDNILPLFEGLCEAIQEGVEADVADLGEALDELIDQDADVLHPETAAKFSAVLDLGKLMATELERTLGKADDVTKKKIKTITKAYRQAAEVLAGIITEITLVEGDDDEENEDQPDEGDAANEADDEDEIAADGEEG